MKISKKGSAEDFKRALEEKIAQLEGTDVNSATNTSNIIASDSTANERFIHNLIGDIEEELDREIDSISFDQDDENLYVTVTYMGHVKEYKVPFSDLTMNFDTIEQDSSYIVNTVLMDLDNVDDEGFHDYNEVNGSTNDSSYEKNDDPQDFVNYVDAVLKKLKSVGCDIDDEEVIHYAEAAAELIAYDDNHDVEDWWRETKRNFMDEIEELPHVIENSSVLGSSSSKQQMYEDAINSVFGYDSSKVAFTVAGLAKDALLNTMEDARDTDRSTIDTKQIVNVVRKQVDTVKKGIKKDSKLGLATVIQLCKKLSNGSDNNIEELDEARRNMHKLNSMAKVGNKACEYLYSKLNPSLIKNLEQLLSFVEKEF